MILWRISNYASLDGKGGLEWPGRWHTRGRGVVYFADSPAAALLETLVHFEIDLPDLPARYRLIQVVTPAGASVERVSVDNLPPGWIEDLTATQAIGDAWLSAARSLLLVVPSAIVPATHNVLMNPGHPEAARVNISSTSEHVIDPRLIR